MPALCCGDHTRGTVRKVRYYGAWYPGTWHVRYVLPILVLQDCNAAKATGEECEYVITVELNVCVVVYKARYFTYTIDLPVTPFPKLIIKLGHMTLTVTSVIFCAGSGRLLVWVDHNRPYADGEYTCRMLLGNGFRERD